MSTVLPSATVRLRPVADNDRDFLFALYASTRAAELAPMGWDDVFTSTFLRQQFDAQDASFRGGYAEASFDIVEVDGVAAGRLYLHRRPAEILVIDIAFVPEYQGRGIGSALLGAVLDEAAARGARVTLHVERSNRARALYERLGFGVVDDGEVYLGMAWEPASGEDSLVAHGGVVGSDGHEEQLEGADLCMLDGVHGLLEHEVRGRVEQQRERHATTGADGLAQAGDLRQAQLGRGIGFEPQHERVTHPVGERVDREGLQHRRSPGRLVKR
jgi:ribosomal protein S18 acetylase RimI-like enzyme